MAAWETRVQVLLFGAFCFGGTLVCYRGTRALKSRPSERSVAARARTSHGFRGR